MNKDLIVVAAYHEWHPKVPPGKVRVLATAGGRTHVEARRRAFLLDAYEYDNGPRPFIIDPTKHLEEK